MKKYGVQDNCLPTPCRYTIYDSDPWRDDDNFFGSDILNEAYKFAEKYSAIVFEKEKKR